MLGVVVPLMPGLSDFHEEVGRRIRQSREMIGLTQEQMAEQLGMSGPGYNQWEKGRRRIPVEELRRLAHLLGQSMAFLLGESTDVRGAFAHEFNEMTDAERRELLEIRRGLKRAREGQDNT